MGVPTPRDMKGQLESLLERIGILEQRTGKSVPVGTMCAFAGPVAPSGWGLADGRSYATVDHPALFAVIGYTYGGSGANFSVPNLKEQYPMMNYIIKM